LARLVILPGARRDLIEIGDYIALDNPRRAASFVAEIEAEIARIAAQPGRFPARADLAPGLRAARRGRYLIFFLEAVGEVQIVRIIHGARDLPRALDLNS
jgi:toxin ParE1/3/4